MDKYYKDKNVLITGGLGFLGSNLAHRLIETGAKITILDNLDPRYGGNLFNIDSIQNDVCLIIKDVREENTLIPLVEKADYIFHFAAQVSYIDSLSNPIEDLDLNGRSPLLLLELCKKYNNKVKIIFPSSRMVIGSNAGKLFNEDVHVNPISLYGLHKYLTEKYFEIYYREYELNYTVYRIMNPYGPRQQVKHSKYSLVGWFIRQAMENKTIKIFGDGNQTRNYIYIDDIIDGIFKCSSQKESNGQIINLGTGTSTSFVDMVRTVINVVGLGDIKFVPWPENYEKMETGSCVPDISKLKRISGFTTKVNLEEGVTKTHEYFLKYYKKYFI